MRIIVVSYIIVESFSQRALKSMSQSEAKITTPLCTTTVAGLQPRARATRAAPQLIKQLPEQRELQGGRERTLGAAGSMRPPDRIPLSFQIFIHPYTHHSRIPKLIPGNLSTLSVAHTKRLIIPPAQLSTRPTSFSSFLSESRPAEARRAEDKTSLPV